MSVGETVSEAKKWCNQARKLLNLGMFSSKGKSISGRADKISKELATLEKSVKGGKIPLTTKEVEDYAQKFSQIASSLKSAAETDDALAVEVQFNLLKELKRELAVHLAKAGKAKTKAEDKLDETVIANFPGEKRLAEAKLTALKNHAGASAVPDEIAAIQKNKIDAAQSEFDKQKYADARKLLTEVEGACQAATLIADQCARVLDEIKEAEKKLAELNVSPQKAAIKDEIEDIQKTKIDPAKDMAFRKNYAGASLLLADVAGACVPVKLLFDRYTEYLSKLQEAEQKLNDLPNPDGIITADIAKIRTDKIEEAKKAAAHKVRDYATAGQRLGEVAAEALKAKKVADDHAAYKLALADAKSDLQTLIDHAAADFIESEIAAIKDDLIAKAEVHVKPPKREYDQALDLLGKVPTAFAAAESIADKCDSAGTANWTTWKTTEFQKLKKHAQKEFFTSEIARMQKLLDASKACMAKGLTRAADKLLNQLHWNSLPLVEFADAHTVYVTKLNGSDGKSQLETLKTSAPTTSNDAIVSLIQAIEKKLLDAAKKATGRKYPAAMALLNEIKPDCAAAQLKKNAHGVYAEALKTIEPLVTGLPEDSDLAIGPEAKAIRAKLALAKAAALPTKGDFAGAKALLDEIKNDLTAAKKIADAYAENAKSAKSAKEQTEPSVGLAEVRKLVAALKIRDTGKLLAEKLKEMETALTEAEKALTA